MVKKFPSLKTEYPQLLDSLAKKPVQGIPIGNNCYKLRIAIASKRKGKSGGARVITYIQIINKVIVLLTIYDKADQENISDKELNDLLKNIG